MMTTTHPDIKYDIIDGIHLDSKIRVLEVNSKNNSLIDAILETNNTLRYFGLEYTEKDAKQLNSKHKNYISKKRAIFSPFDTETIPFVPNFFHAVIYSNPTLLHQDTSYFLKDAFRVTARGGHFALVFNTTKQSDHFEIIVEAQGIGFEHIKSKLFVNSENLTTTTINDEQQILLIFKKPNPLNIEQLLEN